jgi:hypothetical protein
MKNRIFFRAIIIIAGLLIAGCDLIGRYERGNGNVVTTTREVEHFDKISLGGNFEVILSHGSESLVTITTDENLEPLIETEVYDGVLEISTGKKLISAKKSVIRITYRQLEEIRVFGATMLSNEDTLESGNLTLQLSGAGVIDLQLKVSELTGCTTQRRGPCEIPWLCRICEYRTERCRRP